MAINSATSPLLPNLPIPTMPIRLNPGHCCAAGLDLGGTASPPPNWIGSGSSSCYLCSQTGATDWAPAVSTLCAGLGLGRPLSCNQIGAVLHPFLPHSPPLCPCAAKLGLPPTSLNPCARSGPCTQFGLQMNLVPPIGLTEWKAWALLVYIISVATTSEEE